MRVKVWVETEAEANVSIADVMSSIAGLADSDRLPMILDCISSVWRVLSEIPDAQIAAMNDKQRETIATALTAQAQRYVSHNAEVSRPAAANEESK